ncbi:MAG: hypothetical protein H0X26_03350 [Alphaproteobacteria bacterium]|nr:hypothetical protein [Alphaproteobacteria bacterium]
MQNITSLKQQLDNHKAPPKFIKISTGNSPQPDVKLVFSKKDDSSPYGQEDATSPDTLLQHEHTRATNSISQIVDPLWQDICADLLHLMGPASVLKVWKSKLGELSCQDNGLDITCTTEETAAFVQQYDFVILGSLQRYFPALTQLRVGHL